MMPDQSGTIFNMKDGSLKVVTIGGETLTGQAAVDFVRTAQENYTNDQRSIYSARETGKNEAAAATAAGASYADRSGTLQADVDMGQEVARERALGAAAGTQQATSNAEVAEMQRNMPGLLTVVDQLDVLADTATYTTGGQVRDRVAKELGMEPGEGAIARAEYIAVVDNQVLPLLRQTFGAAFTAKEGDTLRATLGDPDKSPAEKKAVLRAFIEQKKRDLLARGGTVPTSSETPPAAAPTRLKFNPETGEIE